jgi:hypothetical protein
MANDVVDPDSHFGEFLKDHLQLHWRRRNPNDRSFLIKPNCPLHVVQGRLAQQALDPKFAVAG